MLRRSSIEGSSSDDASSIVRAALRQLEGKIDKIDDATTAQVRALKSVFDHPFRDCKMQFV
jgi:hypothetical protein